MLTIHGVPPSPFVRKVRVALAEKGVEYELKPQLPFNQPAEYLALSPLGKIPCLQDGAFALPDSSVICAYLERRHPSPSLYPGDPEGYGRALWYEEYADTRLAESVGPIFVQIVVRPRFFRQEPDKELVERTKRDVLPPVLDYLEREVPASGGGLVGGVFSIADIAIATQLLQLRHAGHEPDAARWPKLCAHLERLADRPSFASCFEEERQAFASA